MRAERESSQSLIRFRFSSAVFSHFYGYFGCADFSINITLKSQKECERAEGENTKKKIAALVTIRVICFAGFERYFVAQYSSLGVIWSPTYYFTQSSVSVAHVKRNQTKCALTWHKTCNGCFLDFVGVAGCWYHIKIRDTTHEKWANEKQTEHGKHQTAQSVSSNRRRHPHMPHI